MMATRKKEPDRPPSRFLRVHQLCHPQRRRRHNLRPGTRGERLHYRFHSLSLDHHGRNELNEERSNGPKHPRERTRQWHHNRRLAAPREFHRRGRHHRRRRDRQRQSRRRRHLRGSSSLSRSPLNNATTTRCWRRGNNKLRSNRNKRTGEPNERPPEQVKQELHSRLGGKTWSWGNQKARRQRSQRRQRNERIEE